MRITAQGLMYLKPDFKSL